jgi:thiol-disulfide isomerase/thioredoxin
MALLHGSTSGYGRAMKTIVAASLMLLACHSRTPETPAGGDPNAARPREALVGMRAPDATLEMLDGQHVALASLIGQRPVYLKFWATWCKPCREQMPHLEAAYKKYGDRVAVFAVDLGLNDAMDTVRAFRSEPALTVPVAFDGDGSLAERFRVMVTPQHILIDRSGVVRFVGHEASPELDRALESLVADGAAPHSDESAARTVSTPTEQPLSLTLTDGSTFTIAGHAGKRVALTFVTTWCDGYLAKTRPAMSEACIAHAHALEAQRRAHADLAWVIVAHPVWTETSDLEPYRTRLGVGAAIGIDDRAAWFEHFKVRDVPTTIVLDEHGTEVARAGGRGEDLARALSQLPAAR